MTGRGLAILSLQVALTSLVFPASQVARGAERQSLVITATIVEQGQENVGAVLTGLLEELVGASGDYALKANSSAVQRLVDHYRDRLRFGLIGEDAQLHLQNATDADVVMIPSYAALEGVKVLGVTVVDLTTRAVSRVNVQTVGATVDLPKKLCERLSKKSTTQGTFTINVLSTYNTLLPATGTVVRGKAEVANARTGVLRVIVDNPREQVAIRLTCDHCSPQEFAIIPEVTAEKSAVTLLAKPNVNEIEQYHKKYGDGRETRIDRIKNASKRRSPPLDGRALAPFRVQFAGVCRLRKMRRSQGSRRGQKPMNTKAMMSLGDRTAEVDMRTRTLSLLGCVFACCFVTALRASDFDREKLRKQLIKHEGRKTKVYKDTQGIPTIGVGFNLNRSDAKKKIDGFGLDYTKVKEGKQELTEAQIDKLLEADIDSAATDCKSVFPKFAELSDVRQRVLIDMMFNLGNGRFEQFKKMIENIKAGKYAAAADEMKASKWYEQVKTRGKTLENMMRNDKDPA